MTNEPNANEYPLTPEELQAFGELGANIITLRGQQAPERRQLLAALAKLDAAEAAAEGAANGALRMAIRIRGLQGDWTLDHANRVIRKVEAPAAPAKEPA